MRGHGVDAESAALASTVAATLVTLLTTDSWIQVKKEIGDLWRRFRPSHADAIQADLAQARETALAADGAVASALVTEWESRLRELLAADRAVAAELTRVTVVLARCLPRAGNTTISQRADVRGQGRVIQAGRDVRTDGLW